MSLFVYGGACVLHLFYDVLLYALLVVLLCDVFGCLCLCLRLLFGFVYLVCFWSVNVCVCSIVLDVCICVCLVLVLGEVVPTCSSRCMVLAVFRYAFVTVVSCVFARVVCLRCCCLPCVCMVLPCVFVFYECDLFVCWLLRLLCVSFRLCWLYSHCVCTPYQMFHVVFKAMCSY